MGVRCLCLLHWETELEHILVAIGLLMGHDYEQHSDSVWYARRIKGIRAVVHGTPLSEGSSYFEIDTGHKFFMDINVDVPKDNPLSLSPPDLMLLPGARKWGLPWNLISTRSSRTEVALSKRLVTVFGGSYAPQEHDYTEVFKGLFPKSRLPEESGLLPPDYEEDTYAYYMTKLWGLEPLTQDELRVASKEAYYNEVEE